MTLRYIFISSKHHIPNLVQWIHLHFMFYLQPKSYKEAITKLDLLCFVFTLLCKFTCFIFEHEYPLQKGDHSIHSKSRSCTYTQPEPSNNHVTKCRGRTEPGKT